MKFILLSVLLFLPFRASAGDADMDVLPGLDAIKTDTPAGEASVQRPDAQKIMSEISEILHLSSKQEDRISRAVNKKTREFDSNMDDYEENSAQEKKWRFKMNENLAAMKKINEDMPDVVRDFLDDEQRQAYDDFLAARNKPAPAAAAAAADGEKEDAASAAPAKPGKKRKLIRRKKGAAPAAAVEAGQEEAGGVMVDKDTSGAKPAKKRKLIRRKKAAAPVAPAAAPEPAPVQEEKEPAGAQPTGKEAPAEEEDAGAYP